jgi:Tol biopolymer transport system component
VAADGVCDSARQTEEKVEAPGSNVGPRWSPAGNVVTFTGVRRGHFDVLTLGLTDGAVRPLITVLRDYLGDGMVD